MSRNDDVETVEIEGEETGKTTDKAIQYDINDKYVWIPKSLILDSEVNEFSQGTLTVPEWFADQEGLI